MYTAQTLYRTLVVVALFIPVFYNNVGAQSVLDILCFMLALVGVRSVGFFLFPEKEKQ